MYNFANLGIFGRALELKISTLWGHLALFFPFCTKKNLATLIILSRACTLVHLQDETKISSAPFLVHRLFKNKRKIRERFFSIREFSKQFSSSTDSPIWCPHTRHAHGPADRATRWGESSPFLNIGHFNQSLNFSSPINKQCTLSRLFFPKNNIP
jgi:hypothetical protein